MIFVLCGLFSASKYASNLDSIHSKIGFQLHTSVSQQQNSKFGEIPIFVVNKVTESRGIDDIESQSNSVFFDIGANSTDIDGLWDFNRGRCTRVLWGIQTRVKQSIHQRRLSQSRFP